MRQLKPSALVDLTLMYQGDKAAARRMMHRHLYHLSLDWQERRDFYEAQVQEALPTLPPEGAAHLSALWSAIKAWGDATTDAARDARQAEIDAILNAKPDTDWDEALMAHYDDTLSLDDWAQMDTLIGDELRAGATDWDDPATELDADEYEGQ